MALFDAGILVLVKIFLVAKNAHGSTATLWSAPVLWRFEGTTFLLFQAAGPYYAEYE